MERSNMSRILVFTGKGGVGKTSVAAAHARKASQEGKNTLIVSTDMAHNLSELFEMTIGREEVKISERLTALEIDPYYEMEHHFSAMLDAFYKMFPREGDNEEFLLIPGMEELFSLFRIQELYLSGKYDVLIVDGAPTGETLSLLKFPELLSWYMEKFFPLGRVAVKVMRPITKCFFQIQLPDGKAMNDIEKLYYKLYDLQRILKDGNITSIRIVTIPEKMVVEETKKNYMYLNLYNFPVDGLYINRILPKEAENEFFSEWMTIQKRYLDEIYAVFSGIPIYPVKWYETDLNGVKALDRVVADALEQTGLFEKKEIFENEIYEKTEGGYRLKICLPFVEKDEVQMYENGQDLIIKIGNYKRNIPLPQVVKNCTLQSARFEEQYLYILFQEETAKEV